MNSGAGDLNEFARQCLDDCYTWFPTMANETAERQIVHFTLGMAGEVGEVVELIKKWHGGRPGYNIEDRELLGRIAEEICDVLQYVGDLAFFLDLDLDRAMDAKRAANAERFGRLA